MSPFFQTLVSTIIGAIFGGGSVGNFSDLPYSAPLQKNGQAAGGRRYENCTSDGESGGPETGETHKEFECDFNAFFAEDYILDPEDVRADPSQYLDYKPEEVSDSEQRLRDIETAITELGTIIGG